MTAAAVGADAAAGAEAAGCCAHAAPLLASSAAKDPANNPGSEILSAQMMLVHMGWKEAADIITKSLEKAVVDKVVTYDFARLMPGSTQVSCSGFGKAMIERM